MVYKEKIVDIETGQEIWRDYTTEEIKQIEAAQAEAKIKAQAIVEAEAKRFAALAKLEALGLDEDDLKALGL